MNNKSNFWDVFVKTVLVIIIIILLLTRFTFTIDDKKGNGEDKVTPTGNTTIIEFKCDKKDDTCQPVEEPPVEDPNNGNQNNNNGNKNNNHNNNNNNNQEDNNDDQNNDNQEPNNNNNEENNNGEPVPEEPTPVEPEPEEPVVDEPSNEVEVFDKDKDYETWSGSTNLNIFKDSMYVKPGTIAPESTNTYKFIVKNGTSESIKYNINFVENNASNINMKYKLKKNDEYLISEYVSYSELDIANLIIESGASDTYLLEWKWVSSDNDNYIGANGATYSLQINVDAESI